MKALGVIAVEKLSFMFNVVVDPDNPRGIGKIRHPLVRIVVTNTFK